MWTYDINSIKMEDCLRIWIRTHESNSIEYYIKLNKIMVMNSTFPYKILKLSNNLDKWNLALIG